MVVQTKTTDGITYDDFHADTPESMKNEKRIVLERMAQGGSAAVKEYQDGKALASTQRNSALNNAATLAQGNQALARETQDYYTSKLDPYTGIAAGANASGQENNSALAAGNAQYLEAVASASQLDRADLNKGGGGGGRGGGGGGGGGDYWDDTPAPFDPFIKLEEAGLMAGLMNPDGSAPSGTRLLFGQDNEDGTLSEIGGDTRAKGVFDEMIAAQQSGLSPAEMLVHLKDILDEEGLDAEQEDAIAVTLINYFALGEGVDPAMVGDWIGDKVPEYDPKTNRYTTEGFEYTAAQEDRRLLNNSNWGGPKSKAELEAEYWQKRSRTESAKAVANSRREAETTGMYSDQFEGGTREFNVARAIRDQRDIDMKQASQEQLASHYKRDPRLNNRDANEERRQALLAARAKNLADAKRNHSNKNRSSNAK